MFIVLEELCDIWKQNSYTEKDMKRENLEAK